jgi:bacteriocin-like protein
MKKLKISHLQKKYEVLTKEQLKQVLGGENENGSDTCGSYGDDCNTYMGINCCSGLVCAEKKCWYGALSND